MKSEAKGPANVSFKKRIAYQAYGILYTAFKMLPISRNKAYFVMTHDTSDESNCGVMRNYLRAMGYDCFSLNRNDTNGIGFIFSSAYHLATCKYIFLDNAFLPLAYLRLRHNSKLTMLWHGTGTIKKFGQHVNVGSLKELEARCGRNISLVTVSSEATRSIYAECFNVPVEKVAITGLPRTDVFFEPGFAAEARASLEVKHPEIKGKKLVLYAPTFRDEPGRQQEQFDKIVELAKLFTERFENDDVVLGLRLHPSLGADASASKYLTDKTILFTKDTPLNTLLGATDLLITDYSSIIFEYSLLRRPMSFYAYDLDRFEGNDRGFYRDYRSYVPGNVLTTAKALTDDIAAALFSVQALENAAGSLADNRINEFISNSFTYFDSHSAERIFKILNELQ